MPLGFNGRWAWLYRWFSGRPLNGHRYTDATGFRHGTMAVDISGRATAYQLLPGYQRFLVARLPLMAVWPYLAMAYLAPWRTGLATLPVLVLAGWRVAVRRRRRAFRRQAVEPVATGVASVLRVRRIDGQGHRVVDIPRDFRDDPEAKITIKLPTDWIAQDGDRAALVKTVATRLSIDELTPSWHLAGAAPYVTLSVPQRPPKKVTLADVRDMAAACPADAPMVGVGARGVLVDMSLALESPHMLINAGSGAGKSEFLAFLVGQLMRHGFGVAVADAKYVSHMWLRKVPGVAYASDSQELHELLIWLDGELFRRARFVAMGGDPATIVPLVAVLEEINTAAGRLRSYWRSIKETGDPAMSPALTALANLASMGREMRLHILMAGQSITAKSTGGPEARESFGIRAFARATTKAWAMLAPQIKPAPVKRSEPGRWHIVVGDTLREFQAPLVDLKVPEREAELIEWATSGLPVPDVSAMIAGFVPTDVVTQQVVQTPRPEGATTLREYAAENGISLGALRQRVSRAGLESVGAEGSAKLYRVLDLDLAPVAGDD